MALQSDASSFVNDLVVKVNQTGEDILKGVSCTVAPGEILGVAGETGSGKTTLALSFLRYTAPGLSFKEGEIVVSGQDISKPEVTRKDLSDLRGKVVSYVPQDPGNALPAGMRIRQAFANIMKAHGVTDDATISSRLEELFSAVGLPHSESFINRYSHQLSGGQQQRVAIAIAFALSPKLVVMDEPSTGLDAQTTRKVMALIRQMSSKYGSSIVFVSHDLRLLLALADRVAVMYYGEIVEVLPAATFRSAAKHKYTQALIEAIPEATINALDTTSCTKQIDSDDSDAAAISSEAPLLAVENLSARYGAVTVTHDINFTLEKGICLALVGESGSGKTTIARCIAGIHDIYTGEIALNGELLPKSLTHRSLAQKQHIQYVFQNPTSALNPRKTVGDSIMSALRSYGKMNKPEAKAAAQALMEDVGLRADHLLALPRQLSGGQRQRVCLARALAANPDVLICDEVTSSLDVIVQSEVIQVIKNLQEKRHLTVLFITHDLGLAQDLAQRTMVLLKGQIVEAGCTADIISNPKHPYTQSLVASATATQ